MRTLRVLLLVKLLEIVNVLLYWTLVYQDVDEEDEAIKLLEKCYHVNNCPFHLHKPGWSSTRKLNH